MTTDDREARALAGYYLAADGPIAAPPASKGAVQILARVILRLLAQAEARGDVFQAGWDAGFQEALQPDLFPHQNRCKMAYQAWLKEQPEAQD